MSACNSSGVAIIITSAHLAASATGMVLKPAASALLALAPGRTAITTSLTPESRMFWAWAWPWRAGPGAAAGGGGGGGGAAARAGGARGGGAGRRRRRRRRY